MPAVESASNGDGDGVGEPQVVEVGLPLGAKEKRPPSPQLVVLLSVRVQVDRGVEVRDGPALVQLARGVGQQDAPLVEEVEHAAARPARVRVP